MQLPRVRQSRFLLLSLGLHALLFAFLFGRARSAPAPQNPPAVMIDLAASAGPAQGAGPASPTPRAATRRPAPSRESGRLAAVPSPLSAFAPVHRPNLNAARPGEITAPEAAPGDPTSPFVASEDVLQSVAPKKTGALSWVYRKAQFSIGYPEAFVRHDIIGQTQARLVFDAAGKLKPELLSVHSDSPYLRIYVYRALESAFSRDGIPANLVRWPDTFEVFCYVRFTFAGAEPLVAIGSGTPIVGNKLYLARRSSKTVADKLKWDFGPFHGLLPVPVVGMDMTWFARKIEEHEHPLRTQAEADDLAPYRKDPLF